MTSTDNLKYLCGKSSNPKALENVLSKKHYQRKINLKFNRIKLVKSKTQKEKILFINITWE